MFLSAVILEETRSSLNKPKLIKAYRHTPEAIRDFCAGMVAAALLVEGDPACVSPCRDPNYHHVIAAAVGAAAPVIVTGDNDLVDLGQYGAVRILTPRQSWPSWLSRDWRNGLDPCYAAPSRVTWSQLMTITLYGVTRSRASRNVWLCLEAGIAFEQVPVIQARRVPDPLAVDVPLNTKSPSFLEINPNGLVPALQDGELVLNESLAINLYLAKKVGPPIGPADLAEDGQMSMWSTWVATEVEPHATHILFHRGYLPEAEREPAKAEAAAEALIPKFAVLDAHLEGRDWLVADRFTVADLNVAEVVRYAGMAP